MRRRRIVVIVLLLALATMMALSAAYADDATGVVDATLGYTPELYQPTAEDLAYAGVTAGDVAEIDVRAVGTGIQYTGVVLNGDGVNPDAPHPFLKVQQQSATGSFEWAACYLGNNSSAGLFGLGFFALSQPFNTAHMRATRVGSTVTIDFTNVNGGALPNQSYECQGAPAPPGGRIGINGLDNVAKADNFAGGGPVLDTFSYVGPLGGTGNWVDVAPGMNADGAEARGGFLALSFFIGQPGCPPRFIDTLLAPNLVLDFSTGANAGSLLILVITPSGTATVGPFSLPANYCTPIQTGFVPTNPPVVVIGGIIYGGGGPTVLDFEPVP